MSFIISFVLSLLTFFIFFAGLYLEIKKKSPVAIFYAAIFVLALTPNFLNLALGGGYPERVYEEATVFIFIYMATFLFARTALGYIAGLGGVWSPLFIKYKRGEGEAGRLFLYMVVLAASVVLFFIGLRIFSLQSMLRLNWWDLVSSGSPLVIIATYLAYAASPIVLVAVNGYREHPGFSKMALLLMAVFLLFSVFVLKTRSYVLMMTIPFLIFSLYESRGFGRIKLLVYGSLIVFAYVFTRAVRHATDLAEFLDSDILSLVTGASSGAETSFIQAFYYFILHRNQFEGFEENISLMRIFFFWLPSFIIDLKPPDFSYYMHAAYYGSSVQDKLSMHPTIFGDAYGNAGMLGAVTYAVFLAGFICSLEKLVALAGKNWFRLAVFSSLSVTLLIFARGAVYNGFMYTVIPLSLMFCLIGIASFLKLRLKRVS